MGRLPIAFLQDGPDDWHPTLRWTTTGKVEVRVSVQVAACYMGKIAFRPDNSQNSTTRPTNLTPQRVTLLTLLTPPPPFLIAGSYLPFT